MARALAAARLGFRRLFSISSFTPPPAAAPPPKADPSPNLFVSGLSKRTTSEGLREAFSKFGEVIQAKVVTDRVSGYSKGFGFVRYATTDDANEGIKGMDGKFLDGWVIFAEYSRPRPPPPSLDQPSQPSSNYASPSHSNYFSSPTSHSPSYYPSDAASNFSSQASHPQTSPPTSQPESSYSSSYFNRSPPPNYTPETSPAFQATQPAGYTSGAPNYAQSYYGQGPTLNQFSQPPPQSFNYAPQASGYSPQKSEAPLENARSRDWEACEPSASCSSEPLPEYGSGRAANY